MSAAYQLQGECKYEVDPEYEEPVYHDLKDISDAYMEFNTCKPDVVNQQKDEKQNNYEDMKGINQISM